MLLISPHFLIVIFVNTNRYFLVTIPRRHFRIGWHWQYSPVLNNKPPQIPAEGRYEKKKEEKEVSLLSRSYYSWHSFQPRKDDSHSITFISSNAVDSAAVKSRMHERCSIDVLRPLNAMVRDSIPGIRSCTGDKAIGCVRTDYLWARLATHVMPDETPSLSYHSSLSPTIISTIPTGPSFSNVSSTFPPIQTLIFPSLAMQCAHRFLLYVKFSFFRSGGIERRGNA